MQIWLPYSWVKVHYICDVKTTETKQKNEKKCVFQWYITYDSYYQSNSTVRDTIEQQTTKLETSDTYASSLQPTAKVYP